MCTNLWADAGEISTSSLAWEHPGASMEPVEKLEELVEKNVPI